MVGNDIVDLLDPESAPGARHPRFDERVFAAPELEAIRSSVAPERLRWLLWAAKESAFKLMKKLDGTVVFSPRRFVAAFDEGDSGVVRHGDVHIPFRVSPAADVVHVVAALPSGVATLSDVSETGDLPPSVAARRLAVEALGRHLAVDEATLEIVVVDRIPAVRLRGERFDIDVSLSHHGRLAAFACAGQALSA